MTTDAFDIPDGPIHRAPIGFRPADDQEAILYRTLLAAGVELGPYDQLIIRWFAEYADWPTFAVITSWIQRAAQGAR